MNDDRSSLLQPRRFWIDDDDALRHVGAAPVSEMVKAAARSLHVEGLAVLRGVQPRELCRGVIDDYARYTDENRDYVRANLTPEGREKRLVNFHLWSGHAAAIATNPEVMAVLDFLFASRTAVYTSLTFKYGTQQPAHRDTPHFATWPPRMFVGVWTALEDVRPEAGPLFYHPGGQRFAMDPAQFMAEATERLPDAPLARQLDMALDLYNGAVIRQSSSMGRPVRLDMKAGDTVIWHPDLPHGGSPASDPDMTRWSTVFHCAPVDVQVHQHDRFFTHRGDKAPPDRYGYGELCGRPVAVAGGVAYM